MRGFGLFCLVSALALGCGGSSDDGGSGGSGGATGGAGGTTGGSGGVTGGSGGATGGSGGVAGATGGAAGSPGGAAGSGATGGAAGAGGTGTGATGGTGGTGGVASPECKADGDCKVFTDCCSCEGVPNAENPTACPANCLQAKCSEISAPKAAACIAGRCVMGFDCDSSKVTCKSVPPSCAAGQVALVNGNCWQGSCVPADECHTVKDCAACTGPLACVTVTTQIAIQRHCVDIPAVCGGAASCACFGPSVCTSPYTNCTDMSGIKGVGCDCPNC